MEPTVTEEQDHPKFLVKHGVYQILAAVVVHSLAIHAGINMAYSTILLPQISELGSRGNLSLNVTSQFIVDKDQATWIASLVAMGTPVGALMSGFLMDKLGRRAVMIMTALVLIAAWSVCATATHVYTMYGGRSLAGLAAGLSTVALVYVAETSHATLRPVLLSLSSVFVTFGILLTTLLGQLLDWRGVAWSCAVMGVTSLLAVSTLPESPVWLHNRPRPQLEQISTSLKWLYRDQQHYEEQYHAIRESIKRSKTDDQLLIKTVEDKKRSRRSMSRPMISLLVLFLFQQLSGGYIVIFYAIQIFKKTAEMEVDEWTSVTILGVIRFAMALVCSILSLNVGRRPLLAGSAAGMAASLAVGACANFISPLTTHLIQVGSILVYVFFSSFGMLVIPWTLIGEFMGGRRGGVYAGLIISYAYILMFVTVKMFIYVMDVIGLGYTLLLFAVVSFLTVIYVYLEIPETKGKTFEEIQASF